MHGDCSIFMRLRVTLSVEYFLAILLYVIYKALPIEHCETLKHSQVTDSILCIYLHTYIYILYIYIYIYIYIIYIYIYTISSI